MSDGQRNVERTKTHEPSGGRPSRLQLLVFGDGWSRVHELDAPGGEITIGRDASCTLVVDDPSVSRCHAAVSWSQASLTIRDLQSSNGVEVEGVRLAAGASCALADGARVRLGGVSVVAYGGATPTSERSPDSELPPDDPMHEVHELCDRVARSDLPVLILGETGTGKELLAERIHLRSTRAQRPFLRINAAAVPETIAESQLFGHERGAFTGAMQAKDGVISAAHGGTLLLDEVADLPLSVQTKLLRVLESGAMMRVGATTQTHADVRWLAATSRDVDALVGDGLLRPDLVFRLAGVTVYVPPLRERRSSIVPIAAKLLRAVAGDRRSLSSEAARALEAHDWPGNVRELKAAIQRAVVLSTGDVIEAKHLFLGGFRFTTRRPRSSIADTPMAAHTEPPPPVSSAPLKDDVQAIERERILAALAACGGNQTRASEMLGISRRTLTSKLNRLDVARPRKRT